MTSIADIRLKVNSIQDNGDGSKSPPTSFFPVTCINVGISHQNFLTFSFNTLAILGQNFTAIPSVIPKLVNLNQKARPYCSETVFFSIYSVDSILQFITFCNNKPGLGCANTFCICMYC